MSVAGNVTFESRSERDDFIRSQFPGFTEDVSGGYVDGIHALNGGGYLEVRGLRINWDKEPQKNPYVEGPNCTFEGGAFIARSRDDGDC